jgi:ubiquinone/menaquinone biosynthesis C-methylase UbiE
MDKKLVEQNHYDRKAGQIANSEYAGQDAVIFTADNVLRRAHIYFVQLVNRMMQEKTAGTMLDYGCGPGTRTLKFINDKWQLTGIDISEKSLELARIFAEKNNVKATYLNRDCEQTNFPDKMFDLIIDYGTFSSLDMKKALPEILRILKTDGTVIAIETLGHNPVFNLKRFINVLLRKRTHWAARHIMKIRDWNIIKSHFQEFGVKYFGFLTPLSILFVKLLPEKISLSILNFLEKIDDRLLQFRFLQRYAFKTVAVMSNIKKRQ